MSLVGLARKPARKPCVRAVTWGLRQRTGAAATRGWRPWTSTSREDCVVRREIPGGRRRSRCRGRRLPRRSWPRRAELWAAGRRRRLRLTTATGGRAMRGSSRSRRARGSPRGTRSRRRRRTTGSRRSVTIVPSMPSSSGPPRRRRGCGRSRVRRERRLSTVRCSRAVEVVLARRPRHDYLGHAASVRPRTTGARSARSTCSVTTDPRRFGAAGVFSTSGHLQRVRVTRPTSTRGR
jgi:hypothetical protein